MVDGEVVECPGCASTKVTKYKKIRGVQFYDCDDCGKRFREETEGDNMGLFNKEPKAKVNRENMIRLLQDDMTRIRQGVNDQKIVIDKEYEEKKAAEREELRRKEESVRKELEEARKECERKKEAADKELEFLRAGIEEGLDMKRVSTNDKLTALTSEHMQRVAQVEKELQAKLEQDEKDLAELSKR